MNTHCSDWFCGKRPSLLNACVVLLQQAIFHNSQKLRLLPLEYPVDFQGGAGVSRSVHVLCCLAQECLVLALQ